jgi:hypothetical protein
LNRIGGFSDPIQQAISSKRTGGIIGSEQEKWSSFQSHKLLFRAYFKTAAALNKRVLHLIWLRRRQQRRSKQEKYKKSIWIRKIFQERQWKSKYHLLIEELKLP